MIPDSASERGSAPIETTFAIVLLVVFVLGVLEVALAVYGRNVLNAAAHEGARAAVERGRDLSEVETIARATVERATGRLVDDLAIDVGATRTESRLVVRVEVSGALNPFGPIPLPLSFAATATASKETLSR